MHLPLFDRAPALYYGLSLALGTALTLILPLYLIPTFLLLLCTSWRRVLGGAILCIAALVRMLTMHPQIELPEKGLSGTGYFKPERVQRVISPFGQSYCYQGKLISFQGELHHLPCRIYSSKKLPANTHYLIEGRLFQKGPYAFLLKPKKGSFWKPVEKTFSLAEMRYQMKTTVRRWIRKEVSQKEPAQLLSALATGDLEERELAFEFGRLGLSHVLAISGFHFSLLALFLGFLLRGFFSLRAMAVVMLTLLSTFFFYMGFSPSISRAWIGFLLPLVGFLFGYKATALNALGMALMVALIIDPLSLRLLGFQLSYLATFGILTFYKPIEELMRKLLPKRLYETALKMPLLDQYGVLLSATIRSALSLNIAVHLFTLPLVLFNFHKFPWLSLIYNLFFPLGIALSLLLLLLSGTFAFWPYLAKAILALNANWTSLLLYFSAFAPKALDFKLRGHPPLWGMALAIQALIAFGLWRYERAFSRNSCAYLKIRESL